MAPRPPIQAVIEPQAELDPTRRNWRLALFGPDGEPLAPQDGAVGPQGPQGVEGPQGVQGIQGPPGEPGPAGSGATPSDPVEAGDDGPTGWSHYPGDGEHPTWVSYYVQLNVPPGGAAEAELHLFNEAESDYMVIDKVRVVRNAGDGTGTNNHVHFLHGLIPPGRRIQMALGGSSGGNGSFPADLHHYEQTLS